MASFWENFAEAMGWGKANHTKHFSDISEEDKKRYADRYADSANRNYEDKNPGKPKIENAKQNGGDPFFTRDDDQFVGEYNSDNENYETRVYNFKYLAPRYGDAMDTSPYDSRDYRTGKVLLRVPKGTKSTYGSFGEHKPWFDDKDFMGSNIGVYEAVLDDGSVIDADGFRDLVQANPYGSSRSSIMPTFKLEGQDFVDAKDKLKAFNKYKNNMTPKEYETKWDTNWRRWMTTTPPKKKLYTQSPDTYTLYNIFKPGPNGE